MPTAAGVGFDHLVQMMLYASTGSVLADSDVEFGKGFVFVVQKFAQFIRIAAVPTVIFIPGNNVRHKIEVALLMACRGGEPGRVFLFCQLVQLSEERHRGGDSLFELVVESPETDRGVIVVLADQFGQLLLHIFVQRRCVVVSEALIATGTDKRNFAPEYHSGRVALVVHLTGVLIVRQANGIGSHLPDHGQVAGVVFGRKGISLAKTILMTTNTVQGKMFAIEQKPFIGIDRVVAQPQRLNYLIEHPLFLPKRNLHFVEVRIGGTIP